MSSVYFSRSLLNLCRYTNLNCAFRNFSTLYLIRPLFLNQNPQNFIRTKKYDSLNLSQFHHNVSAEAATSELHDHIPKKHPATVTVNFEFEDGNVISANGKIGDSILDVVEDNNIDIDGYGACDGALACSTCHVILSEGDFEKTDQGLNQVSEEELDMLDLASDLTDTSRLGCQVILSKSLDGMTVKVPGGRHDARD